MTESTPREPHERRYIDGIRTIIALVDHMGEVRVTEEALHEILVNAGWREIK